MCHEYACDVAASLRGELHCTVSHRRSVPRSRGSPCEPLTPGGKVRLTRIWIAFIDSVLDVPEKKIESSKMRARDLVSSSSPRLVSLVRYG